MNPDISAIVDSVGGLANRPRAVTAGDDPDFRGPAGKGTGGITAQEVEVGLQSTVDPYFTANIFLTIANMQGIEVEEAYALTTGQVESSSASASGRTSGSERLPARERIRTEIL
jgi:hypothetical protein